MVARLLVALAAVLLVVACCGCSPASAEERSLLEQVCQPKKGGGIMGSGGESPPRFTSPSQVRKLIEEQQASQDGTCDSRFNAAFSELAGVLEPSQLEDVCSPQMYALIRAYHAKFIHFYLPESTREELLEAKTKTGAQKNIIGEPIPEALRDFFILFVKQVDATCKQHLVAAMQSNSLMSEDDFAVLERYKQEGSRLDFLYELTKMGLSNYGRNKASDFNQLQIVDLIGARIADSTLQEGSKLYVQVRFDDRLKRIKTACEKRFTPIYMELFAPVIRLNNLGYIERLKSEHEDRELDENKSIRRWFLVIQACEVLKDIEVLHDSSAMSAIVGIIQDNSHLGSRDAQHQAELRKVKILSTEEASHLRERVENSSDEVRPSYDPDAIEVPHERVAFTPRMWLTQPAEIERELAYFQKDLDHLVWQRTSKLKQWRENAMMLIKQFYHKHKNEIADRDEGSALGRLALFFERHRAALVGVSIMLNVIFLSVMLTG